MKNIVNKLVLFGGILGLLLITLIFMGVYSYNNRFTYDKVKNPTSYKELYQLMKNNNINYNNIKNYVLSGEKDATASNYSKTNIQVAGVDEADIVKTDGEYIYILGSEYLYIVSANGQEMEIVSKIKTQETKENNNSYFVEMYINDNKLIVIKNTYQNFLNDYLEKKMTIYSRGNQETSVVVFDITDKKNPEIINELVQSGNYISSRMINNYLYVTTNYYVFDAFVEKNVNTYVPSIKAKESKLIAIDDIHILPNPDSNAYLTVTGIDINNSNDFISSKAVFGSLSNIYANQNNLFVAGYSNEKINDTYVSKTNLIKFSMNNGIVELTATGSVNGNILNQFSMDEYNDYFRIVTTSNDYTVTTNDQDETVTNNDSNLSKNHLFILDNDLKIVGKIEDLASDERVYSVRFDEEVAYFVTFKQVDPLFVVDISTPNKPTILSELKIPGFSEYLHKYDDKYLFGLGKEADKDGRVTGLKISMFDIQDKSNVTEKYKLIIGDENSWSESSYNHKAIMISQDKNIIAFPVNDNYVVYRFIDGVGFEEISEIKFNIDDEIYYYGNVRGLYIDDYLYVTNLNKVLSYNLNDLEDGIILELEPIEYDERKLFDNE